MRTGFIDRIRAVLGNTKKSAPPQEDAELPHRVLQKNGLILRRMDRHDEEAWRSACSWLGGLPRIDPKDWPRCRQTDWPLHHVATVDLRDIPSGPWADVLPQTGALAFFVDASGRADLDASRVLYTAQPDTHELASPPEDCPSIGGSSWSYEDINVGVFDEADAAQVMRRWPVEFVHAQFDWPDLDDDPYERSISPDLQSILGKHRPFAMFDLDAPGQGVDHGLIPWDAARRVVERAQHDAPGSELVAKWDIILAGKDLFAPMGQDMVSEFEADVNVHKYENRLPLKYKFGQLPIICRAAEDAVLAMMLGSRDAYERIPEPLVEFLNVHCRRPTMAEGSHQMFGIANNVQGAAIDNAAHELLLQIESDHRMGWMFADVGVWQFWMATHDLEAHAWDRARGFMESH